MKKILNLIEDNCPQKISRDDIDDQNIKYIPHTNNMFAVSRSGHVYSFSEKSDGGRIGSVTPSKYIVVNILYDTGERKMLYIHRIVAEAFIPNPENKPQVSHLNEIPYDNRVENLDWASAKENCDTGDHNKRLAASIKKFYKNRNQFGRVAIKVHVSEIETGNVVYIGASINDTAKYISSITGNSTKAIRVQISNILNAKAGFRTVAGYLVRRATNEEYKEWNSTHINELLREEPIDLSLVPVGKLNKLENLVMTNRKLDPKTGKISYTYTTFSSGDKITNHLQ